MVLTETHHGHYFQVFVGTRAAFFTLVNSIKVAAQLKAGLLDMRLLSVSCAQGLSAVIGVALSKIIMARMSKTLFTTLEYMLMAGVACRLVWSGLAESGDVDPTA